MASPTLPPIAQRAETGATLLDRLQPTWPTWINLQYLDLSDAQECILGQLYGTYQDGLEDLYELAGKLEDLAGNELDEAAHGFILYLADPDSAYDDLTAAWRAQVTARQTRGGGRQ